MKLLMYPLVLQAMFGLGDGIYARPFVHAWALERTEGVWLWTPWPQLYEDIPGVRFARPHLALRTQSKNMRSWSGVWERQPPRAERKRFHYHSNRMQDSIVADIERQVGWPTGTPFRFDLPDFGASPVPGKVAVVRPVTLRGEWPNAARNPDPAYVAEAAGILRDGGYTVVLVADIDDKAEPLVGELPEAGVAYLHGELPVTQLLALVQHSAVCVGGPGWIVPASIAAGTPLVCIAGGQGAHNAPEKLTDPRMDTRRVRWILPDHYCRCGVRSHRCRKVISDFPGKFSAALAEVAA